MAGLKFKKKEADKKAVVSDRKKQQKVAKASDPEKKKDKSSAKAKGLAKGREMMKQALEIQKKGGTVTKTVTTYKKPIQKILKELKGKG